MTKREFQNLFEVALESAVRNAEEKLGSQVPRTFQILLYGANHSGDRLEPATALNDLYISENKFYRIIDVAVLEVNKDFTTVFVRASGHQASSFEETWNQPLGSGPFKQLIAAKIRDKRGGNQSHT